MNILSFDIEEWSIYKMRFGDNKEQYKKYDTMLSQILDLLDKQGLQATFFCLGALGKDFPEVIKAIVSRGHEVGCHSHRHNWLTKLSEKELIEDTRTAIDSLEQVTGKKIISYRAPAFSIGENNKWALEILAECGIQRDASIFPAARDFGGFANLDIAGPALIEYNGVRLKEFPVSTTTLLGKELVYSGGGYFRFFPLSFIQNQMAKSDYNMSYFHIGDLLHSNKGVMSKKEYEDYFKEPGSLLNRYKRHIKSNLGTKGAWAKFEKLIKSTSFIDLDNADKMVEWDKVKTVKL